VQDAPKDKAVEQVDPVVWDLEILQAARDELRQRGDLGAAADLCTWLDALLEAQGRSRTQRGSRHAVRKAFKNCLRKAGITTGRIAELGGPFNSDAAYFPDFEFEWLSLYPVKGRDDVIACDIGAADHIEDERYDAIFSVSVLEHVAEPWKAASQMTRLLKPGGIMFHAAPFSYFYHGAPADFWRFTPDGFAVLFPSLRPMMSGFYAAARRRDNRGSDYNAVTRDGGDAFAPDAFGGWRENWITLYCGLKSPQWAWRKQKATERQCVVDLMRQYVLRGKKFHEAARIVAEGLRELELGPDYHLRRKSGKRGINFSRQACIDIYRKRHEEGPEVSYNTFALYERFEYLLNNA